MDARAFLDIVTQYAGQDQKVRSNKLATVDPAYVSGACRVTFDGTTNLSAGGFSFLDSYSPVAGDRVLMIPVGNTYLVVGAVA